MMHGQKNIKLITFPSPEIVASINMYVFVLSRTIITDLLLLLLLLLLLFFLWAGGESFPTRNITLVITPNCYAVITVALANTASCSPAQH